MLFIGLAAAAELAFFYVLGRLHRADRVDPRMRYVMLLIFVGSVFGALALAPMFFTYLKVSLREPRLSIQAAPYGVNVSYRAEWSSGVRGQPDIVYASLGEQVAVIVIVLAVGLTPYAGYVLGRSGLPRVPRRIVGAEARLAGGFDAVDPGRVELLELEVEELRRRVEELEGDGYWEAVEALISG